VAKSKQGATRAKPAKKAKAAARPAKAAKAPAKAAKATKAPAKAKAKAKAPATKPAPPPGKPVVPIRPTAAPSAAPTAARAATGSWPPLSAVTGEPARQRPGTLPGVAPPPRPPGTPTIPPPMRVVPPAPPGEVVAVRDVGRLLRHGEVFGANRIEIRMVPWPVVITSGRVAVGDPLAPRAARVLARQVPPGKFRAMLSVAHVGAEQRVAAAVMHVGRPPIARWVIAHFEDARPPKSADAPPTHAVEAIDALMDAEVLDGLRAAAAAPDPPVRQSLVAQLGDDRTASGTWIADAATGRNVVAFPAGDGAGEYAAYWALDAIGQPVCLVVDFDVFGKGDWKQKKK
jgi:hypothetical protein